MTTYFKIQTCDSPGNPSPELMVYSAQQVRSFTSQQDRLCRTLAALEEGLENGSLNGTELLGRLKAARLDAEGPQRFLDQCDGLIPASALPTEASTLKAEEVFGTPELVENILQFLAPREMLVAQRTSRTMNATILTSPKLQRLLYLRPDSTAYFSTAFKRQTRQSFHVDAHETVTYDKHLGKLRSKGSGREAIISFAVTSSRATPLGTPTYSAGSRIRSMLVCQPPIKCMTASPSCCQHSRETDEASEEELSSSTGLTCGDVVDFVMRMQAAHKVCAFEDPYSLDDEGFVRPTIYFSGTLTLHEQDPLALTWQKQRERDLQRLRTEDEDYDSDELYDEDGLDERGRRMQDLEDYTEAKIDGE